MLEIRKPHLNRLKTLSMNQELREVVQANYDRFSFDFKEAIKTGDYPLAAALADSYMNLAKEREATARTGRLNGESSPFGDKSKYYSSILEEIPVLLIEEHLKGLVLGTSIENEHLVLGGQCCVIRQCITPELETFYETKKH